MRYIKTFNESTNTSEIEAICEKYYIKNYNINNDGSIDVNGNVLLWNRKLTKLPLKFRNVYGDFKCVSNKLISLEGAPQYVGSDFNCSGNQLTSLEGAPKKVYGSFWCDSNNLKNIDYLPKTYKKLNIKGNPIFKILVLFVRFDERGWASNITDKELISEFIDREMIQQDILLVNRLVEFLDDIDKPKSREELIELLKNDYTIR